MTMTTDEVMTLAIRALIDAGSLSPAARDMRPADALHQWAEANAMTDDTFTCGLACGCRCDTCEGYVVVVPLPEGDVHATYQGGPYVDLSFGRPGRAVEVVNVWDYAAGRPHIPQAATPADRRRLVTELVTTWAQDTRDDWPEFFDTYAAQ